jgi:hypothetical protein
MLFGLFHWLSKHNVGKNLGQGLKIGDAYGHVDKFSAIFKREKTVEVSILTEGHFGLHV